MARSEINKDEFFRRKKDVEGRVGGLREEWGLDYALHEISKRENIISQPDGAQFLGKIHWAGLEEIFLEYATRSDPEYLKYKHDLISKPDRIRFFDRSKRWGSARAECYPAIRLLLLDFDSLKKEAKAKNLDEELYPLLVLIHEEVHIASGEEPRNQKLDAPVCNGLAQRFPRRVLNYKDIHEGRTQKLAIEIFKEYIRRWPLGSKKGESAEAFLRSYESATINIAQKWYVALTNILDILLGEYAGVSSDTVSQAFSRGYFRRLDFSKLDSHIKKIFGADIKDLLITAEFKDDREIISDIMRSGAIQKILKDEQNVKAVEEIASSIGLSKDKNWRRA